MSTSNVLTTLEVQNLIAMLSRMGYTVTKDNEPVKVETKATKKATSKKETAPKVDKVNHPTETIEYPKRNGIEKVWTQGQWTWLITDQKPNKRQVKILNELGFVEKTNVSKRPEQAGRKFYAKSLIETKLVEAIFA